MFTRIINVNSAFTGFKTVALIGCVLLQLVVSRIQAEDPFELPPIDYTNAPTTDPVFRLQEQINAGEVQLAFDPKHGYLPAVLEKLQIPVSSQMLVFSQTSFQLRKISPERPRAVYFNEATYLGYVQFGDVLELSAVDPQQGAVFYTLEQQPTDKPRFVRDRGQCLSCHASSRTQNIPGHLVRSVFPNRLGVPTLGTRSFLTDHTSPLEQRWGGWYVTGTHGNERHMGNTCIVDASNPENFNRETGANLATLDGLCNTSPYLSPHSDLVALMVMEHQTQVHNAITRANYECRMATYHDEIMNRALSRPMDHQSETTQHRIQAASDNLLKYLLLAGEYQLKSPVSGTSGFASEFSQSGIRDPQGRSLRELDLQSRLFRYPCSYLIYSAPFDALLPPVKQYVFGQLKQILNSDQVEGDFAHLSLEDRRAIFEILMATKAEFKDFVAAQ